ncbi:hypothetical protein [Candidatus Binatus sp.]|uniref:hypothetical protein n=1 Tax=Candidatus Binatus sp. TaxID=2811406 RepID=UPI003C72D5BD
MPSLIGVALITVGLGFLLAVPCIIETTPITMCLFFFFGIPLFGLGFLLYAYSVFKDLRTHGIL